MWHSSYTVSAVLCCKMDCLPFETHHWPFIRNTVLLSTCGSILHCYKRAHFDSWIWVDLTNYMSTLLACNGKKPNPETGRFSPRSRSCRYLDFQDISIFVERDSMRSWWCPYASTTKIVQQVSTVLHQSFLPLLVLHPRYSYNAIQGLR